MAACPNCGSGVPETSRFCQVCGSRMKSVKPEVSYSDIPPGTVVVCPKCGAQNFRTDAICRKCDTDLTQVKKTLAGIPTTEKQGETRRCNKCGRASPTDYRFCSVCGYPLIKTEKIWYVPGQVRAQVPGQTPEPEQAGIDSLARVVFYLFSFLIPPLGVILGAVFYMKYPDPTGDFRDVGRMCLVLALVSLIIMGVIGGVLWIAGYIFATGS